MGASAAVEQEAGQVVKWFVYDNETYYPSAEVVEADSAEGALAKVCDGGAFQGAAVFPFDALALWVPPCWADSDPENARIDVLLAPYDG